MARRDKDNESSVKIDPSAAIQEAIEARRYETETRERINYLAQVVSDVAEAARMTIESTYEIKGVAKDVLAYKADELDAIKDALLDTSKGNDLASASNKGSLADTEAYIDALFSNYDLGQADRFYGAAARFSREEAEALYQSELAKNQAEEEKAKAERDLAEARTEATKQFYEGQLNAIQGVMDNPIGNGLNAATSIWGGLNSGNYGSVLNSIGGLLGQTSEFEGGAAGLAGVLESMGFGGAASAVGGLGMTLGGPAMAAVLGTIASGDALLDSVAQARYAAMRQGLTGIDAITLGPGTALQDALSSFGTGIDTRTIQQVRNTLFQNQAEWGSEEYDQGFDFAMGAQLNYGISADRAARYYTDMVVKGGESMDELNSQMDTLRMTVENTSIGMEQMEQVIKDNTATLARATGGDQLAAQGMALDLQQYYMNGTGRESGIAAGMIGNVDFATDPLAYEKFQNYVSQGYDETQAMMLASMDYVSEGRVLGTYGNHNYFIEPLTPNGLSLSDYLSARDFDGLEDALEEFWTADYGNGMTYFGLRAALKAQFGFTDQDVESPQSIVDAFRGAMGGVDAASTGETYEYDAMVGTDRQSNRLLDNGTIDNMIIGNSGINTLMRGDDELSVFTEEGGGHFTDYGYRLAQLMQDAGVDFGDDGVTATELSRMGDALRSAYTESETEDDFSAWLMSDEGKTQAQLVAEKFENTTTSTQEARDRVDVNIEIGYRDGSEQTIMARVIDANRAIARDEGEQASG